MYFTAQPATRETSEMVTRRRVYRRCPCHPQAAMTSLGIRKSPRLRGPNTCRLRVKPRRGGWTPVRGKAVDCLRGEPHRTRQPRPMKNEMPQYPLQDVGCLRGEPPRTRQPLPMKNEMPQYPLQDVGCLRGDSEPHRTRRPPRPRQIPKQDPQPQ
jgi:hypothetical protein